jgi:hypothetical protein
VIENPRVLEPPPPGLGLTTVISAEPAFAMSLAGIAEVNCVLVASVARLFPFQRITEPETKLEPVTVRTKAGPPAVTLVGERPVITGTGFITANRAAVETPPPGAGLDTVTCALPAIDRSAVDINATSCVLLTKVVGREAPFHKTVEPERK